MSIGEVAFDDFGYVPSDRNVNPKNKKKSI